MDPFWASVVEFWWVGPLAVGAGVAAAFGLRPRSAAKDRRIAVRAARHDVREAEHALTSSRVALRLARAELRSTAAARAGGRASFDEVVAARRELQRAKLTARSAAADVRTRRQRLGAARAELPTTADPARRPLVREWETHDAVVARWMEYETDPGRAISFPAMSDARTPATAAFLTAMRRAQELRPLATATKIAPEDFSAYRDAVSELRRALDIAERAAGVRR